MAYPVAPVTGGMADTVQSIGIIGAIRPLAPAMSPARPAARIALRDATHEIHTRMHRHPALARLAAGTITAAEYRAVLARSLGFYAIAEPVLGLAGRLTDCLAVDLAELGFSPAMIADLPRCAPLAIADTPAVIGGRYVLIGASMGGKVMARALAARRDGGPALPVRFLTALSQNDWAQFTASLDENLPDAASRNRAAVAAAAIFAVYENWMAWHA